MFRLFLGWGLTALFIAAITGIFYGILYGKGHAVEQALARIKANPDDPGAAAQQRQALAATIVTMLLIIFFNKFCLSFVLHIFTDIQKHRTGSEFQFSFGLKYTLGLFFTTAIMTIIVEISVFHNVYSEKYGVVEEESIMFFLNSFLVPIILLINPWYIFKLIKRWYYKNRPELTQRQANNLMQDPQYTMGKPYAQIIESVWFTYLYSSIIPGGTILILLGFAFYYWVDKFTLLKRSTINQNVNGDLCMWAMKLIDASLLLRAVGEFVFDSQIRDSTTYESIICICIGAVYLALPMNKVLQFFHNQKFKIEEKSYLQAKSRFIQNYHTMHPLYTQQKYALGSKSKILGTSKNFMAIYAPSIEENRSQNQLLEINLFKKKSFA